MRARRAQRRNRPVAQAPFSKLPAPPPEGRARGLFGALGSALVHAAVAALVIFAASIPRVREMNRPVEVAVLETVKPPPPKEEEKKPEPPKEVKAPPKPVKKIAKLPPPPKDAPPPPPEQKELPPPPPNDTPPPDAKPSAPVMIGISLSSTTAGGSFAAAVGNTLYGSAPKVAPRPEEAKPYAAPEGRYVPPYKVTTLPELLREVKAKYPEEARKLGLEGQVVLRLTIDSSGKVSQAKLVKAAASGFDEAALEAVKRFRFKPGTDGGEAIATEITYTYTFLLD
jgi:protein TonB